MFGNVSLRTRPLRFACLVDPEDKHALRSAVELNSSLWGGKYNPIIPLYRRIPKKWRKKSVTGSTGLQIVGGYLDTFDPDIIIRFGKKLPRAFNTRGLEIIDPSEIWKYFEGNPSERVPQYGAGIFEILDHIFDEHFQYVERFPTIIDLPRCEGRLGLFWSSVFGSLPSQIYDSVVMRYSTALQLRQTDVNANTASKLMSEGVLYPTRLSSYSITSRPRSSPISDFDIFYMDPMAVMDIIDFWNLRAAGRQVLPLPKQLATEPSFCDLAVTAIESTFRPMRHNKDIYHSSSFICSHNTDFDELQEVTKHIGKRVQVKQGPSKKHFAFSVQHWYPRMWEESGRYSDGADCSDLQHDDTAIDFNEVGRRIVFSCMKPDLVNAGLGYGKPRCANEITFRFYDPIEYRAQVLPTGGGPNVKRAASSMISYGADCRIGRNGLVALQDHFYSQYWDVPTAQSVFSAWLKDLGWEAEVSVAGAVAKQLYSQLGGEIQAVADKTVLSIFEEMAGGTEKEKEKKVGEVKKRLSGLSEYADLHGHLVSKGVFRIGPKVKCPRCQRYSWYSLEAVSETLTCPLCLNEFGAVGQIDQSKWWYRTIGPISVPKHAEGGFTTLFAVKVLQHQVIGLETTPVLSFNMRHNSGAILEADFGALWRQSTYGKTLDGVLFGECKSYNSFERSDVTRMRSLARAFPGAVIAFCTLKDKLDSKEKRLIAPLALSGHRYWKDDRPINPVLILTSSELLSRWSLTQVWQQSPQTSEFAGRHELLELCDASQRIHLGIPSWHQTWNNYFEKKRRRRSQNRPASSDSKVS